MEDELVSAIQVCLECPGNPSQPGWPDFPTSAQIAAEEKLRTLVASLPELQVLPPLFRSLNMSFGWDFMFAPALQRIARRTSPAYAARALRRVAKMERAEAVQVFPLWNLRASSRASFGSSLELLPFSDLPPSSYKDAFTAPRSSHAWSFADTARYGLPQWAVIARQTISPLFSGKSEPDDPSHEASVIHTATAGDLELLFSCQTQSPVFSLMYWAQFDDPDLNDFAPQWLAHPHIELTPRGLHDEGRIELDVNSATSHFSTFEAHPAKFRASLRRSLQRLRNAMVRTDVGDQAVDLCVGLEALMVPDQGEHRYKLSLRSALLIGDTLRRRMEVKDIVDGLYKVRGATAHGSKKEGKMKVLEADVDPPGMIRRGIPLCAEVFLELLRRGPIDWSQLELNPPPLVTGTLHASTPTAG